MKTVKFLGNYIRVSNEKAARMVSEGRGEYAPKRLYKEQERRIAEMHEKEVVLQNASN